MSSSEWNESCYQYVFIFISKRTIAIARDMLRKMGLIGKMNEEDVKQEIRSVFRDPIENDPNFPFTFLQGAGEGSKTLVILSVSTSYYWTAQQVARLGGQKGNTYILALTDMPSLTDQDIIVYGIIV